MKNNLDLIDFPLQSILPIKISLKLKKELKMKFNEFIKIYDIEITKAYRLVIYLKTYLYEQKVNIPYVSNFRNVLL